MRLVHALLGYKHTAPILDGLNIEIKKGDWIFLCGRSGSGKSTTLQTLAGLMPPLSGLLVDETGQDIYSMSSKNLRAYRRTCGMIFQDYKLIPSKTVFENIAYAMEICRYGKTTIHRRTREVLMAVDMLHKKDSYPDHLSGGESQRVALARALIHEPTTILADEPTGSLDQKNTMIVMGLLEKFHQIGTTIIFATHDRDLFPLIPYAKVIDLDELHTKFSTSL